MLIPWLLIAPLWLFKKFHPCLEIHPLLLVTVRFFYSRLYSGGRNIHSLRLKKINRTTVYKCSTTSKIFCNSLLQTLGSFLKLKSYLALDILFMYLLFCFLLLLCLILMPFFCLMHSTLAGHWPVVERWHTNKTYLTSSAKRTSALKLKVLNKAQWTFHGVLYYDIIKYLYVKI